MADSLFDPSPDIVIELEEMGVCVDDILEYARCVLGRDESRALLLGLERQMGIEHPTPDVETTFA